VKQVNEIWSMNGKNKTVLNTAENKYEYLRKVYELVTEKWVLGNRNKNGELFVKPLI
jgi:hypothetical protein